MVLSGRSNLGVNRRGNQIRKKIHHLWGVCAHDASSGRGPSHGEQRERWGASADCGGFFVRARPDLAETSEGGGLRARPAVAGGFLAVLRARPAGAGGYLAVLERVATYDRATPGGGLGSTADPTGIIERPPPAHCRDRHGVTGSLECIREGHSSFCALWYHVLYPI